MQGLETGRDGWRCVRGNRPDFAGLGRNHGPDTRHGASTAPARPPWPDSAIVMTDGKIARVGPAAGLKAPQRRAGSQDMSGKFVQMPGIIDSPRPCVGMMR